MTLTDEERLQEFRRRRAYLKEHLTDSYAQQNMPPEGDVPVSAGYYNSSATESAMTQETEDQRKLREFRERRAAQSLPEAAQSMPSPVPESSREFQSEPEPRTKQDVHAVDYEDHDAKYESASIRGKVSARASQFIRGAIGVIPGLADVGHDIAHFLNPEIHATDYTNKYREYYRKAEELLNIPSAPDDWIGEAIDTAGSMVTFGAGNIAKAGKVAKLASVMPYKKFLAQGKAVGKIATTGGAMSVAGTGYEAVMPDEPIGKFLTQVTAGGSVNKVFKMLSSATKAAIKNKSASTSAIAEKVFDDVLKNSYKTGWKEAITSNVDDISQEASKLISLDKVKRLETSSENYRKLNNAVRHSYGLGGKEKLQEAMNTIEELIEYAPVNSAATSELKNIRNALIGAEYTRGDIAKALKISPERLSGIHEPIFDAANTSIKNVYKGYKKAMNATDKLYESEPSFANNLSHVKQLLGEAIETGSNEHISKLYSTANRYHLDEVKKVVQTDVIKSATNKVFPKDTYSLINSRDPEAISAIKTALYSTERGKELFDTLAMKSLENFMTNKLTIEGKDIVNIEKIGNFAKELGTGNDTSRWIKSLIGIEGKNALQRASEVALNIEKNNLSAKDASLTALQVFLRIKSWPIISMFKGKKGKDLEKLAYKYMDELNYGKPSSTTESLWKKATKELYRSPITWSALSHATERYSE